MLQVVAQSLRQRPPLAELMMTRVHQALVMLALLILDHLMQELQTRSSIS
jgi:hypothetical protein